MWTNKQTFNLKIDSVTKADGRLEDHWQFLAPREINDPMLSKPSDWVDEQLIEDENDVKPSGWDDISEKIGKRNLANTYVWTTEGGFYAESTEMAETQQEVYTHHR